MTNEEIIEELRNRNLMSNSMNENDNSEISDDEILNELSNRNLFKTVSDGNILPTPAQQRSESPYGSFVDDMEIAPANTRSKAVEEYLKSPEFARLALEVTGGVAGAYFAPVIAPAVLIGRAASIVRPALQNVVTRMSGAGFGETGGAAVSQTFDPTFDARDD